MEMEVFKGLASVFRFLSESGYRARGSRARLSRSKVYGDYKTGLFAAENPKNIKPAEVFDYINRASLIKVGTGCGPDRELSEIHKEKSIAELEGIKLKNERQLFENEQALKLWLRREDVETQIAVKLGVIDASLKALIIERAAAWLSLAGGHPKKSEMLIELINSDIDSMFDELASFEELEIIFNFPKTAEGGEYELSKQTDS